MKRSNYIKMLQRVSGKTDCKMFYFKDYNIILTVNGWMVHKKMSDGSYMTYSTNEGHAKVIAIRLRYNLGTYKFKKDDSKEFRELYSHQLSRQMKSYNLERGRKRIFKSVKGNLDLEKIKAILQYQKLCPDNTERADVDNRYEITISSVYGSNDITPCIETRHLVKVGDIISNKFSLGKVNGYTDITRL